MTAQRDPDDFIKAIFEDGLTELPDRVYDAVRSEIDHSRQRVVIGPWRVPYMNNFARFAIAGAAILVVVLGGVYFLPRLGGIGGPGATPTQSPSPSPLAAAPLTEGALEPGTYFADATRVSNVTRLTFTVPAGWSAGRPLPAQGSLTEYQPVLSKDTGSSGTWLESWLVDAIYADVCHWRGTDTPIGPTATDLATALAAQTGRAASNTSDVKLGGFPAKRIETVTPAEDSAFCDGGLFYAWPGVGPNTEFNGKGANVSNETDVVYTADVAGKRVVIVASHTPGTSQEDLAELDAIIASIQIEP